MRLYRVVGGKCVAVSNWGEKWEMGGIVEHKKAG